MHKNNLNKLLSLVMALVMVFSLAAPASAAETEAGNYTVDATLSCYVNAMGGVEFSDGYGLLTGSTVTIAEDGTASITLNLGQTSGLSIYGVACTAFIGTEEAPGYYADGAVTTEGVTYTVADTTATGPSSSTVNWIDSITMPVDASTSEYTLWLYLNSNVMGCQLGDGTGSGSSNTPGVSTAHTATLTIDWDSLEEIVVADESNTQTATVTYTVESGYEVSIPATITVGSDMTGTYSVALTSFVAPTGSYVTVTSDTAGTLTNGDASLAFTNALASGNLDAKGETLSGTITVTDTPTVGGEYTGTLNFVISYYEG